MHDPLRPTSGARFELQRSDTRQPGAHGPSATYEARIALPEGTTALEVRIVTSPSLAVELADADPTAPAWALEHLRAIARTLGRAAARGEAWPRRILRWREPRA